MADKLIGDQDCSCPRIASVIRSAGGSALTNGEWSKLARALDTDKSKIDYLRKEMLLQRMEIGDVICDILTDWRTRNSIYAKMETLIEVVDRLRWTSVSDDLREKFMSNEETN